MIALTYGLASTNRFKRVARYPDVDSLASRLMWYYPRPSELEFPFDFSITWF